MPHKLIHKTHKHHMIMMPLRTAHRAPNSRAPQRASLPPLPAAVHEASHAYSCTATLMDSLIRHDTVQRAQLSAVVRETATADGRAEAKEAGRLGPYRGG